MILTIAMTKGGVGKTTTAVNLAAAIAQSGKTVCLVDLDQQGNATYSATGSAKYQFNNRGLFDFMMEDGKQDISVCMENYIHKTNMPNLFILPATGMTNQIPPLLSILKARHPDKKEYMIPADSFLPLSRKFDFLIMDTPPAKDSLTLSGIYAADHIILPVNADKYSLDALMETFSLIQSIRREDARDIHILGILLTKVERNSATNLIREKLRTESFSSYMLQSEIRKGAAITDSTLLGGPVLLTDPKSNPAKDYRALYQEIMDKIKN